MLSRKVLVMSVLFVGVVGFMGAQAEQSQQTQNQPEAAEEVTTEELETFSDTYAEVQTIQKSLNEEISSLIKDSSFEQQEFQSLFKAYSTGDKSAISSLDEKKQQEFEQLRNKISELQKTQQEKMVGAIEDEGLTVKRFNGILSAIQQDSELYQEFQEIHQN